ncbi:L-fucose:H+ symporter permease [Rouxiella badensis]|jgi:FHS family L-fucose permease-like MFS transporter|uniref:L-fucose:H+ symporter permease n=1 Tax=Rouxiella badensis TaxID=1646377 RepID=UPI0017887374|nr:L-fucose:H+ symporter permease [Rouxiella badensis]MCC3748862.1 L-fucose:H+ symporter permease [Rouxiella badensis]QOI55016.1 L-fucose:H+ symporter permease [Rouxiella badensis subsp. acadiensis]WAT10430.1 L-fucose:H+ symporter permease [Rouxiella badensis]
MNEKSTSYKGPLALLTALFFMWGLITSLNDILVPHLKSLFELSYVQASLVQFSFFFAYFVMSYPAGKVVSKFGYKAGIIMGLLVAALGCVLFYPSASLRSYPLFLLSLFILASGLTLLQVAANPYVNSLGSADTAASRLNLTQAFNSLGTTIGPVLGGMFILSAVVLTADQISHLPAGELQHYYASESSSVQMPYLVLTAVLILIALVIKFSKLPVLSNEKEQDDGKDHSLWKKKHLVLGVIGIFAYVGAEVSIGSYLISLLERPDIASLSAVDASQKLSLYWGGAMVGRFLGSVLMTKIKANRLLAFNAMIVVLLIASAIITKGTFSMWAILCVGLFNSIMFPTIFSLALNKLGGLTGRASGVLCMGIVGGAIMPIIQAAVADHVSLLVSFVVPLVCYLYIAWYGCKGYRPTH